MPLATGTRLGPYEILAALGRGGMGEVYRARDTRLDRDVALKVLPAEFESEPERRIRFVREARAIAALSDPHILAVYDVGEDDGHPFLVTELLEGETLRSRLTTARGPLPLRKAIDIGIQVARGLATAHAKGIVHRDLKPENVFLLQNGTAKILDFGLARPIASDAGLATTAVAMTEAGIVMGTPGYVAPEQAQGLAVDGRSDLFALGGVLYEMLSGHRAFQGETAAATLAAVLTADPPALTNAEVSPALGRVVRHCLEKSPGERFQAAHDVVFALEELTGSTTRPLPTPIRRWPAVLAALTVAAVVTAVALEFWPHPDPAQRPRIVFPLDAQPSAALMHSTIRNSVAFLPDGGAVVFTAIASGKESLWIRPLDQQAVAPIHGAENAYGPITSPRNDQVAFVDGLGVLLKTVSVLGGRAVTVLQANHQILGGTWTHDDKLIIGVRESPLLIVSSKGGEATPLTALEPGETEHLWPSEVPGTSVVLFTVNTGTSGGAVEGQLAAVDRASIPVRVKRLGVLGSYPRYAPTGHIVFVTTAGSLRAVAFDPHTLKSGTLVPLPISVGANDSGAADFDVSADGHLVYETASTARRLTWVDRAGQSTPIPGPVSAYASALLSPNGTYATVNIRDGDFKVRVADLQTGNQRPLTGWPAMVQAHWTDDEHVVVSVGVAGPTMLVEIPAGGTGSPTMSLADVTKRLESPVPNAVTADGRVIFRAGPVGRSHLYVIDRAGHEARRLLPPSDGNELNAALSPDGKWIAYQSDQLDRTEVFVRPFPNVDDSLSQISIAGGRQPVWSRNGHELFYLSADDKLMAVPMDHPVQGSPPPKAAVVFDTAPYYVAGASRTYDTTDGQRFLMIKEEPSASGRPDPLWIVLNWAPTTLREIK